MTNIGRLANKLALAINLNFHTHIVVNTTKFYGDDGRPMSVYSVRDSYKGKDGKHSDELYRSSSMVFVCYFLKDLLDYLERGEIEDHGNENYAWQVDNRGVMQTLRLMEKKYGADELHN